MVTALIRWMTAVAIPSQCQNNLRYGRDAYLWADGTRYEGDNKIIEWMVKVRFTEQIVVFTWGSFSKIKNSILTN